MWCVKLRECSRGDGGAVVVVVPVMAGRWSTDLREGDDSRRRWWLRVERRSVEIEGKKN